MNLLFGVNFLVHLRNVIDCTMISALILCMPLENSLTVQVLRALDEAKMAVLPHTALLILSFQSTEQLRLNVLSPTARRATLLLRVVDVNTSAHNQVYINVIYINDESC